MFREIPEYSRFPRFVATLLTEYTNQAPLHVTSCHTINHQLVTVIVSRLDYCNSSVCQNTQVNSLHHFQSRTLQLALLILSLRPCAAITLLHRVHKKSADKNDQRNTITYRLKTRIGGSFGWQQSDMMALVGPIKLYSNNTHWHTTSQPTA